MFWNATMPIWIGVLIVIVWSALVVALILLVINKARVTEAIAEDLSVTRNQKNNLIRENVQLQGHLDTARRQIQRLENVDAQNADLREALQEAMAENKALQMNTIEVPEAVPEPVKRTRKKAGQA